MKAPIEADCEECRGSGFLPGSGTEHECPDCGGSGGNHLTTRERQLAAALNELYENTEPAIGGSVSEKARTALLAAGYTEG